VKGQERILNGAGGVLREDRKLLIQTKEKHYGGRGKEIWCQEKVSEDGKGGKGVAIGRKQPAVWKKK